LRRPLEPGFGAAVGVEDRAVQTLEAAGGRGGVQGAHDQGGVVFSCIDGTSPFSLSSTLAIWPSTFPTGDSWSFLELICHSSGIHPSQYSMSLRNS
jgi:hypothetical protein